MVIFLMDFAAERYVESKYDLPHNDIDLQGIVVAGDPAHAQNGHQHNGRVDHQFLHNGDQREDLNTMAESATLQQRQSVTSSSENKGSSGNKSSDDEDAERSLTRQASHSYNSGTGETETELYRAFRMQIASFLILEFGVIFHSVIIGLNLGTAGEEFSTLYPVLVFHQSFEGLGVGARMSAIPFPGKYRWLPWALCAAYGLTTPIAIAIGLGLRTTYNAGSFTANVVSGVFDSTSAGILLWTGLVELLARDFIFDPRRTRDNTRLLFMVGSVLLGGALMALLGKWA